MSTNDITGDKLITDVPTDKFRDGWELLWGSKKKEKTPETLRSLDNKGEFVMPREVAELKQMISQMDPITLKPKYAPELTQEFISSFISNIAE